MTNEVYEKELFDDYEEQCAAFRAQFRDRTRQALSGDRADRHPVSNIAEFYEIQDNGDGGVTLSTGDFVAYFTRRFGDRLGNMQRSVKEAQNKRAAEGENRAASTVQNRSAKLNVRSAGRKLVVVNTLLAAVLTLSLALFFVSGLMLSREEARFAAAAPANTVAEAVATEGSAAVYNGTREGETAVFTGENRVEIYPVEEGFAAEMAALLNTFAHFGR